MNNGDLYCKSFSPPVVNEVSNKSERRDAGLETLLV